MTKLTIFMQANLFSIQNEWVSDPSPCGSWKIDFKVDSVLFSEQSAFQKIEILENNRFGRMLFLDGRVQITEADEYIYNEMITHVPLLTHSCATDVLIIGGGGGGALREVLRYPKIVRVGLVEIDKEVIKASQKYLPNISNASFEDSRACIFYEDGCEFMKRDNHKYDVIICDSTLNIGIGESLFTTDFYAACSKSLKNNGILCLQAGVYFFDSTQIPNIVRNLNPYFDNLSFYTCSIPSYGGGLLVFILASNSNLDYKHEHLAESMHSIQGKMRYYTPHIHQASFILPADLQDFINCERGLLSRENAHSQFISR